MTSEELARAALRAYFGDDTGFSDMARGSRKRAVDAVSKLLFSWRSHEWFAHKSFPEEETEERRSRFSLHSPGIGKRKTDL